MLRVSSGILTLILTLLVPNVASAQNLRDQHLGQWQTVAYAPRPRAFYSVARWGDFVYTIGGTTRGGDGALTVDRFRLVPESGLEAWVSSETPLPAGHSHGAAIVHQGALYVMGPGPSTGVFRAPIDAAGRLGVWQTVGQLSSPKSTALAAVVIRDFLVVFAETGVERARLNVDGSVSSAWESLGPLPASIGGLFRTVVPVAMTGSHIYLVLRSGAVIWSAINVADSRFGPWTMVPSQQWSGAAIVGNRLYVWGNQGCFERVCPSPAALARIQSDGSLSAFEPTTGAGGSGTTGALGLAIGRWVYSFGAGNEDTNNDNPQALEQVRRSVVGGPIVIDVNPTRSPEVGGNVIVVQGRNFDPAVTVTLGADPPLPLRSVSTTQVEALVPADRFIRNGSSQLTLTIANPDRTEWHARHFIYETLPRTPRNFQATVSVSGVAFSWQVPQEGGPPFEGYELEIGTSSGGSNTGVFFLGNVTSVQAAIAPRLYFARLRTRNTVGRSVPTTEVSFVVGSATNQPAAPTSLQASVTFGRVTLQWQPAQGPQPVAGYVLEAGSAPATANLATQSLGNTTSLVVDGVPAGRYYIRVKAFNQAGIGLASNEIEVVVTTSIAPPGSPRNVAAMLNGNTVTLTWSAPSTGGPVTNYVLEAGTAAGLTNLVSQALGTLTTVTVAGVPPGTYYVRLRAANAGGRSGPSNELVLIVVP